MKTAQVSIDTSNTCKPRLAKLSLLIGALFSGSLAHGGITDISSAPIANTSDISAKPNIMYIIDDSGSMSWDYMPDDIGDTSQYGYKSSQCNGVAYNPNFNYSANLPLQADGTVYPHASFNAVLDDGFQMNLTGTTRSSTTSVAMGTGDLVFKLSGTPYSTTVGADIGIVSSTDSTRWMQGTVKSWNSSTLQLTVTVTKAVGSGSYAAWVVGNPNVTNLNGSTYYAYKGSLPAMSWVFKAAGPDTSTPFYIECTTPTSTSTTKFQLVTVNTASTEAQNYADWYAYYRKRFLMMRTVSGQALNSLDSKYRVGFTTISNKGVDGSSSTFLDIKDFDSAQKSKFYSKVYNADTGGSTPLRGALSKVGRYYAKKVSGQTYDPMQYACQRNYTLLSTDGYWNTGSETSTYTALQMDGTTAIGQQDGREERPMWDGQKDKITTTTPYTTLIHQQAVYSRTYTYNVTGGTYKTWTTSASCKSGQKKLVTYTGVKGVETDVGTVTDLEDVAGTTTQSVVTLAGVVQSTTYSTPSSTGTPTVTGSSASTPAFSSFSMTSSTGSSTGSCTTPTTDSITGTKTLASTSDSGSKTRSVLSQSPIAASGASTVTASTTQDGASNTLADIAEYYYVTDLRTAALGNCTGALGSDVCNNEVPPGDRDKASWQHMTTFTMGLGVGGTLTYDRNYLTQTSGDYNNLKQGTVSWPVPAVNSSGGPTNVDDLWHTAVNGRGQYFATTDPTTLADAISTVLTAVKKATGTSSAAATSTLKPVAGDNAMVFVAEYTTLDWTGNLIAYAMDTSTGDIDTKNPKWQSVGKFDTFSDVDQISKVGNWTTRKVYYLQPGAATPTLRSFDYASLSADGYGSYFTNICSKTTVPAQCSTLTSAQKSVANNATNLVNYLRGDRTNEAYLDKSVTPNTTVALYRNRAHLLGDIINAAPVYVGKPPFHYADSKYADFVTDHKDRKPVVYVASNDGMLHAISGDKTSGGGELWAYVPSFVMKNMYLMADSNYSNNHNFYVDGSPIVGDIFVNNEWKTILVGGLNAGGRGYYAIDVTDPDSPKPLWEFTDTNMGLTYGQPIITKRADGTWVVALTSGYNNTSGDGNGHLYVLNANTGVSVLSSDIATFSGGSPAGTAASPSGLSKLNAWIEDVSDNTSTRFYAGDLLGNLWRFDIDGLVAPKKSALLLANFSVGGVPQSIMTRPETAEITYGASKFAVVMVGTGRYLGTSDIVDKTTQSVYAIKDPLTSSGWGAVRGRSDLVMQTLTETTVSSGANIGQKIRKSTSNPVDWGTQIGWGVDLISSGERVAVDMNLQYTTLAVVSAIPGVDECHPSGGSSWLYNLSLFNGAAPSSADGVSGNYLGDFLGVGLTWIELPNGSSRLIIPGSDGSLVSKTPSIEQGDSGSGTAHTTSWRELF